MLPGLEGLAASLFGGSELGSRRQRFLPNHYQFPMPSERLVTTDEGVRFRVDVGTLLGWSVRFRIRDPSLDRLFGLMRPGMVVLDVGANIGFTALTAATRVGPNGRVFAFEPHPANYGTLVGNIKLNPDLRIEAFNLGLGRNPRDATMSEPTSRNPGGFHIQEGGTGVMVEIDTLDAVVAREGIGRVDVMKIDTEGFEREVLGGADGLLRESRPTIFIELGEAHLRVQGSSTVEVLTLLMDYGYELSEVGTGEPLPLTRDYQGCHLDAIALVPDTGQVQP